MYIARSLVSWPLIPLYLGCVWFWDKRDGMDTFQFFRMGCLHLCVWLRGWGCPCFAFGTRDGEGEDVGPFQIC